MDLLETPILTNTRGKNLIPNRVYRNNKVFEASSELFSGYNITLDVNICNSIEDIILYFRNSLENMLRTYNLVYLLEKYEQCNFHIHSFTFEDIITSKHNQIFYICDHC